MLRLRPFAALRPRPELARSRRVRAVRCRQTAEARALAKGNDLSFLHVSRAEIDLPEDANPYDDRVYEGAKRAFDRLANDGTLLRESQACVYAYRQEAVLGGRKVSQVGVVGCCHVDDYLEGRIKRHEVTRKDKEDDRTRHTLAISANPGPVFLAYKAQSELDALCAEAMRGTALYDFTAPDGVRHTVWRIESTAQVVAAFGASTARTSPMGIIAARRRRALRPSGARATRSTPANEEYNWFLCVLFAADQLNVLPYHRLVRDLNGLSQGRVPRTPARIAEVTPASAPIPEQAGSFGMYLDHHWYRVSLPSASIDASDPVRSLDYVLLSDRVLSPVLGIHDLRTDKRVDFVGGIRGTGELERRVDNGEHALAFAMRATTLEQLMRVADAESDHAAQEHVVRAQAPHRAAHPHARLSRSLRRHAWFANGV